MEMDPIEEIPQEHPREIKYWVAKPKEEVGPLIIEKVKKYYEFLRTSGKLFLYQQSYNYYYNPAMQGAQIIRTGADGEYISVNVNHYRSLLRNLKTLTVSQRPQFEPQATNTDLKSQEQTILATSVLEYYLKEKRLEQHLIDGVEMALLFADGYVAFEWDVNQGDDYATDDQGNPVKNGDISYRVLTPIDYAKDVTKKSAKDEVWGCICQRKNKYDLMAQFPEMADDIESETPLDDQIFLYQKAWNYLNNEYVSDDINVYQFRHLPTPALPRGRLTQVLSNGAVLTDGPLPYRGLYVFRIAPGKWIDSPFGYTVGFDLVNLQQLYDTMVSTIGTNNVNFGVQNLWGKRGDVPDVTNLTGGMKLIESDTKPEALQFTQTAPEAYQFLGNIQQMMEIISGVNAVARGNPEAALGKGASGSSMALIISQAIQYSMDLQQSYYETLEEVGSGIIALLQDFGNTERIAQIVGKSNRQYLKPFTGEDLKGIKRVTVNMGNPFMRSTAGKMAMADNLLSKPGMIEDPQQYIQVLTTGKLEPLYENQQKELMNIRAENEAMMEGRPVKAVAVDNHPMHVLEHKSVLSSPESRENHQLVQLALNHISEHMQLWRAMDPFLAQMLHMPPPPPPVAPPGMVPPGGPPAQGNKGPGGPPPPNAAEAMNPANPAQKQAANVRMPNMPKPPAGTDPQTAALIQGMGGA